MLRLPAELSMKWLKRTSRSMVIAYYASFALAWLAFATAQVAAPSPEIAHGWLQSDRGAGNHVGLLFALAIHAAAIAAAAWHLPRWFLDHGPLAVVVSGAPLVALIAQLWFVPAFFYLIAVLHLWLACRHESSGKLQSSHSPSMENGHT